MKKTIFTTLIFSVFLLSACSDNTASDMPKKSAFAPVITGDLIPTSRSEKANYYLVSVEGDGEYLKTVHSRVSSASHGFSLTRIDCKNNRFQGLGYGDDKQENIKMYSNVKWTDLVSGSSKSDLVSFVCNKQ